MSGIMQPDLFRAPLLRPPSLVAYGAGVDSTAMVLEMLSRGEPIDQILMADTNSENRETVEYAAMFADLMAARGVPFEMVRTKVVRYGNLPLYEGLYESNLANGTIPTISLGFSACSLRWKVDPQHKWVNKWEKAVTAWSQGMTVVQHIGFDCSPSDVKRYAEREGHTDPRFTMDYPLRRWQWKREDCIARIEHEGIQVPRKSSCTMCLAIKPAEVRAYTPDMLRRLVLLEGRASPRLHTSEGIWRRRVLGRRNAEAKPGAVSEFIWEEELLDRDEVEYLWFDAPNMFDRWLRVQKTLPFPERQPIGEWLDHFDATMAAGLPLPPLEGTRVPLPLAA